MTRTIGSASPSSRPIQASRAHSTSSAFTAARAARTRSRRASTPGRTRCPYSDRHLTQLLRCGVSVVPASPTWSVNERATRRDLAGINGERRVAAEFGDVAGSVPADQRSVAALVETIDGAKEDVGGGRVIEPTARRDEYQLAALARGRERGGAGVRGVCERGGTSHIRGAT